MMIGRYFFPRGNGWTSREENIHCRKVPDGRQSLFGEECLPLANIFCPKARGRAPFRLTSWADDLDFAND